MVLFKTLFLLSLIFVGSSAFAQATKTEKEPSTISQSTNVAELSMIALRAPDKDRRSAIEKLVARGNTDIIPTFVLLMRISGEYKPIAGALRSLTGDPNIQTWRDAMLWQEAHPEIIPHESYRALKLLYLTNIDSNFQQFFDPETTSRKKLKIRLEEITWGGVVVDGIPSLDNPQLIPAEKADYLLPTDLVFGISINGDVRAYPLRIMGWHEMFNEVIGGVPVALAYCTLCGSGILFETHVDGREKPLVFGSSGFLYRSNKLMFDRETKSLWNQFTGQPVGGPLVDAKIKLKIRPVAITTWEQWKSQNPTTKVLSLNTGYRRNYGSGVVYKDYFASPELMFPTIVRDESRVKRKDYVFGIRDFGVARAWPLSAFDKNPVINDVVGTTSVVLIGDAATRTVRAYKSEGKTFEADATSKNLLSGEQKWQITEDSLTGPDGETLSRVPGHIAYWFAWDGYLGVSSSLYSR